MSLTDEFQKIAADSDYNNWTQNRLAKVVEVVIDFEARLIELETVARARPGYRPPDLIDPPRRVLPKCAVLTCTNTADPRWGVRDANGDAVMICDGHDTVDALNVALAATQGAPWAPPVGPHLVNGKFQSDKYPSTPPGKVPLSCSDPTAQDLLWEYAQRRRTIDPEFSHDLEAALLFAGFNPSVFADAEAIMSVTARVKKP